MNPTTPPRIASVALVSPAGAPLGILAPIAVEPPWWQEVEALVRAVRERDGIEIVVRRLTATERPEAPGGRVSYLAETPDAVRGETVGAMPADALADHPLRAAYARPGGPTVDLVWARGVLVGKGLTLSAPPVQMRTWNLSSLWRLETGGGRAWLKVVPEFLTREARVLTWLAGEAVPDLIGGGGTRSLMADIAGADLYGAGPAELAEMVNLLVDLQVRRGRDIAELEALGLVDWRAPALAAAITSAVARTGPDLALAERRALDRFVAGLPRRLADLAACGLAETLIHSDFHPGNLRGAPGAMRLLDWGEAGIGHPCLDQAAMFAGLASGVLEPLRARWVERLYATAPGSDPGRAFALCRPLALAKQAAVYWNFLDHIEPDEHPYHRADPADRLRKTLAVLSQER